MSRVVFYDNLQATPLPDDPALVEVERIYCVQVDRFSEADWTRLDHIYRHLPGEYRENQIPFWYGDSDEAAVHLSASIEPPGIQVYGIIPLEQWKPWDAAFQEALAHSTLPFRTLDPMDRMPRLTQIEAFPEEHRAAIRAVVAAMAAEGREPDEYTAELSPAARGLLEVYARHDSHRDAQFTRGDPCGRCCVVQYSPKTSRVLRIFGIR